LSQHLVCFTGLSSGQTWGVRNSRTAIHIPLIKQCEKPHQSREHDVGLRNLSEKRRKIMRKLILTLAMFALVIWAPAMMARAGGGYGIEFQQRVKDVQAQEKAVAAGFAKIEREAAGDVSTDMSTGMWGVPAQTGGTKATPRPGQRSR
jgi:hypothetical protein